MLVNGSNRPIQLPEQALYKTSASPKGAQKGDNSVDFDRMLSDSNTLKQEEINKEKSIVGNGELHIGETKNDKDFREQLEKITGKKLDKPKNKLDQNDYLTLLVTQLKYQDPSKPMENHEMASQMAQFNTVEQLVGVNKTLKNLDSAKNGDRLDKLSQYIDKFVEVDGNNIKINPDKTTSLGKFKLPLKAANVTVEIKDSQGKVVQNIPLGALREGTHDLHWDGKGLKNTACPTGEYSFQVKASTDDGKPIVTTTSYLAKINGVTDILSGGKLESNAGTIDPSKIIAVRNFDPNKPTTQAAVAPKPSAPEKQTKSQSNNVTPKEQTHSLTPQKEI
jgi:flagellar basal-body rod modification protein FlgD